MVTQYVLFLDLPVCRKQQLVQTILNKEVNVEMKASLDNMVV